MKRFVITTGCLVTINYGDNYVIDADSQEEAEEEARRRLVRDIEDKFGWIDFNEVVIDNTQEVRE